MGLRRVKRKAIPLPHLLVVERVEMFRCAHIDVVCRKRWCRINGLTELVPCNDIEFRTNSHNGDYALAGGEVDISTRGHWGGVIWAPGTKPSTVDQPARGGFETGDDATVGDHEDLVAVQDRRRNFGYTP